MCELEDGHETRSDQGRTVVVNGDERLTPLAALGEIAATLNQPQDIETALQSVLEQVLRALPADIVSISLCEADGAEWTLRAERDASRSAAAGLFDERATFVRIRARGEDVGILSALSLHPYTFSAADTGFLRAVADQVGAALAEDRQREAARVLQGYLRAILNSANSGIIITDNRGRISMLNHAANVFFHLDAEEVIGVPLRDAPLHEGLLDRLRRALDHSRPGAVTVFELPLENGQLWSVTVTPLHGQGEARQGEEGWVVMLQNTTFLKEAEALRTQVIQTAAHELRNPLGITFSALMLLQQEAGTSKGEAGQLVDIALSGVNRMQEMIDDLLHLEVISVGVGFERRMVDLAQVVRKVADDMRPHFQEKSQTLEVTIEEDLPTIAGDENWLYQALLNYLSNARKYTPEGGHIAVHAYVRAGEVVVEVEDNGYGIPVEAQARLFERFYRATVTENQAKGTGLGLAIVKSIAEQHGGRVFVHSQPGVGSVFGIALPIASTP